MDPLCSSHADAKPACSCPMSKVPGSLSLTGTPKSLMHNNCRLGQRVVNGACRVAWSWSGWYDHTWPVDQVDEDQYSWKILTYIWGISFKLDEKIWRSLLISELAQVRCSSSIIIKHKTQTLLEPPVAWAVTPSSRQGCSKPHPTWSWTSSRDLQLLWTTCARVSVFTVENYFLMHNLNLTLSL